MFASHFSWLCKELFVYCSNRSTNKIQANMPTRSNYQIFIPLQAGFSEHDASQYPDQTRVGTIYDPVPYVGSNGTFRGVYNVLCRFTQDVIDNIPIPNPPAFRTTTLNTPSIQVPLSATVTQSYVVNWSVSQPHRVSIHYYPSGAVFLKAINVELANVSMGTVTASGTIDNIPFSITLNLIHGENTVTGIADPIATKQVVSTGGMVQNTQYSLDNVTWVTFNATQTLPKNVTCYFRGTFINNYSSGRPCYIQTPTTTQNSYVGPYASTVITTSHNTGTSNFVVKYNI